MPDGEDFESQVLARLKAIERKQTASSRRGALQDRRLASLEKDRNRMLPATEFYEEMEPLRLKELLPGLLKAAVKSEVIQNLADDRRKLWEIRSVKWVVIGGSPRACV